MKESVEIQAPASPRKIFIVEDHAVFREGLAQIIRNEGDLIVCGQAGSVAQALPAISRVEPDLVLVDITLPGKSGLQLIKEVRLVNRKVKLLVVSMHDEALYADRVLRAGGDGFIMKQEDPDEIIRAIRDVLGGRIYVSEQVLAGTPKGPVNGHSKRKTRPLDQLSDSELEILELLGQGKSNREISSQLHLSVRAVLDHCVLIKRKLNLKSNNALIRYAVCWLETGAE
jgi:DNA-binding NarL/FixJ family response regulator